MIYRVAEGSIAESGPIDKIVLFGDSATATAAVTPPEGSSQEPRQQQDQGDAGAKAVTLAQPASPQPWPESMPVLNLPTVDTGDPAAPSMSIGEMLRAHAMAGVQGGQLAGTGASFPAPAASQPASSPPPAPVDATLAETTRRAQQSLGALIDGLAAATRSLQQSLPTGRQ